MPQWFNKDRKVRSGWKSYLLFPLSQILRIHCSRRSLPSLHGTEWAVFPHPLTQDIATFGKQYITDAGRTTSGTFGKMEDAPHAALLTKPPRGEEIVVFWKLPGSKGPIRFRSVPRSLTASILFLPTMFGRRKASRVLATRMNGWGWTSVRIYKTSYSIRFY